jgi:preprotein translocase subunit SecE
MAVAKEKDKAREQSESAVVRRPVGGGSGEPARKPKEQSENALVRTFRETRSELRKVVWPSREETMRLTVVVIAVSVAIGLILFVGDSIFLSLYTLLVNAVSGS